MKVNLGSSRLSKSLFPIDFDSSSTLNFGECIPIFCKEVVADTHLNSAVRSAVRFAPLSLPTFGKAYLHKYSFFYKFKDLWSPFDNFLAQTPFTGFNGESYVPTISPCFPLSFLWYICLCHSSFSAYDIVTGSSIPVGNSPLSVGNFNCKLLVSASKSNYSDGLARTLAFHVLWPSGFTSPKDYLNVAHLTELVSSKSSSYSTFIDDPDSCISPAGSDFQVVINKSQFFYKINDDSYGAPSGDGRLLLCLKLNNSGKFLRKIFMGLGYQLVNRPKLVSAFPLIAFYKSYFDQFAPKRFLKYDQTSFGSVLNCMIQNGVSFTDILLSDSYTNASLLPSLIDDLLSCYYTFDTDFYSSQVVGQVNDYGGDLGQSYVGVDSDGNSSVGVLRSEVSDGAVPAINFNGNSSFQHTQAQQNILSRLTQFVNRRSLLGGKISDLLYSVFGIPKSEVDDVTNPFIGSSVVDVEFSDVFSTAETSEGSLGEYAGKALGVGSSDSLSFDSKYPGIYLEFCCVVPRTQWVQGVNPELFHVNYNDFYNPLYDGITLLPTDKLGFFAVDNFMDYPGLNLLPKGTDNSFGNQSIFAEYKFRTQGILNGDLSLLSTKSTFDSFTLDRTIANYITDQVFDSSDNSFNFTYTSPYNTYLSAGTMWRYVGRWLWLGNFDRIFLNLRQRFERTDLNSTSISWSDRDLNVTDDNLILHNVVEIKMNAPMLPLPDSWLTRDLNELSNHSGVVSQSE